MFDHARHRSRKRRQIKSLLKLFVFLALFWLLIVYGFQQDASDIDNVFGEHLDRNQIEKESRGKLRGGFRKIIEDSDEKVNEYESDAIKSSELKKIEKKVTGPTLSSLEKSVLSDFLSKTQAPPQMALKGQSEKESAALLSGDYGIITEPLTENTGSPEVEQNYDSMPPNEEPTIIEAPPPEELDENTESGEFGEYGRPVTLPEDLPENIKALVTEGWKNHEFNQYVSDLIPLNRTLHDFRSDYCRDMQKVYSRILPTVSIVMVFHNEAWSTLMRSITSIFNRSPEKFINEIILVDDCSTMDHLKAELDEFVAKTPKVRLFRLPERQGLIYARNKGAKEAKSEVLVFLDSHIECTDGWLEPLLDQVLLNETTIAVPVVEVINDKTFELEPKEHPSYVSLGGFNWNLQFRWFHKKLSELTEPQGPVKSPTMPGGLFAISSKFFKHLGMYDPGLDLWGGENLELSFKAWMCGGSIEIVQCSHVGHVFRANSPYEWRSGVDVLRKNSLRVAKVWMDDYAVFFNYATGFDKTDYGDISERVKLREKLECRSFAWYMKNIYPEKKVPSKGIAYGQIQNLGYGGNRCLSGVAAKDSPPMTVELCHGRGGNQFWTYDGDISRNNYCVTYDAHNLMTQHCKKSSKQMFTYDPDERRIYIHQGDKCLAMTEDLNLIMERCDSKAEGQRWKLENLKVERLKRLRATSV